MNEDLLRASATANAVAFDKSRERLEEIITQVRSKDIPLAQSLDLYEEAIELGTKCANLIDRTDFSFVDQADDADLAQEDDEDLEAQPAQSAPQSEADQSEQPAQSALQSEGDQSAQPSQPQAANSEGDIQ